MNTKLSTKILENSPKIQQLESTKWIQVYDGTKSEFESDSKYDSILKDIPKDGLLIFKSNATAINPDGSTSGQWIFYYDGTKEQFEASSDYDDIISNMPDFSLLICNDGRVLNPDGSINEEAIKEFIEQNYLKLTGGELSGTITSPKFVLKSDTNLENISEDKFLKYEFHAKDNDDLLGFLQYAQRANGNRDIALQVTNNEGDNNSNIAYLRVLKAANGDVSIEGPTPPENSPNRTIYNKEALNRDFLPKSGGTLTGNLSIQMQAVDIDVIPDTNTDYSFYFKDKNNYPIGGMWLTKYTNGETRARLCVSDRNWIHRPEVNVTVDQNGNSSANVTTPRGLYNTEIVNYQSMVDYAPQKLTSETTFHVNANTGSDTAGLFNGRGLSEDKPFKTLDGCLDFISHNYFGNVRCFIMLHSDVTFANKEYYFIDFCSSITLQSDSTKRTVTLLKQLKFLTGRLVFNNIKINLVNYPLSLDGTMESIGLYIYNDAEITGTAMKLDVAGNNAMLYLDGVTLSGTASGDGLIRVRNGGFALIDSVSGTVTGKRYDCTSCGRIVTNGKGVNFIPGTIAGTCDSSSTYV